MFIGKYNHKKSEIGVTYNFSFLATDFIWREYNHYTFPDGNVIERDQTSGKTRTKYWDHNLALYYANREKGKYYFNLTLKDKFRRIPDYSQKSDLFPGNTFPGMTVVETQGTRSNIPSLELYFERNLPLEQTLIFNIVGTYFNTDHHRDYRYMDDGYVTAQGGSRVHGEKYSWIGEAYYQKKRSKTSLTIGIKNNWGTISNNYLTVTEKNVMIKNNLSDVIVQYMGKCGSLDYTVGAGISCHYFSEADVDYLKWNYTVVSGLKYQFNENSYIGYSGNIFRKYPDFGLLNDVSQPLNDLILQSGNLNLKS